MRRTTLTVLSLPLIAALPLLLWTVGCPKKGGGSGLDPCEGFQGSCLDLGANVTDAGSGAVARIATDADLIGGVAAQGRAGDIYLANDKIRVIVQGSRRSSGIAPWGGNILDADIVRPKGEAGQDGWDELFMLINVGRTFKVEQIKVFRDGSEGGSAVVALAGHDTLNDIVNVPFLLEQALGAAGKTWATGDKDIKLAITSYYILDPGASKVRLITAFKNESDAAYPLILVDMFDRGGYAETFNPSRRSGSRFGYPSLVPEAADSYIAHVTPQVAYGVMPVEIFGERGLPNTMMTISGTNAIYEGGESLFDITGGTEVPSPLPAGVISLAPGAQTTAIRDFAVARDLAGVSTQWELAQGTKMGTVTGKVTLPGGTIPADTRVAVLEASGMPITGFAVEDDGSFGGSLAAGSYDFILDAKGYLYSDKQSATVAEGQSVQVDLAAPDSGTVSVKVHTPDGKPTPAKVTLICEGPCPKNLSSGGGRFRESDFDNWPSSVEYVGWVPVAGSLEFQVPAGTYNIVVSRGMTWSTFPDGWPNSSEPLVVTAGATANVDAEIARVIDTSGWLGSDLHVHGVNSPDAPILHKARVASYLAEGVDVMVSTDHDFVTDWAPYLKELGGEAEMNTVVGDEMTSFDWGHFNAFPLIHDPAEVQGGALDWGNGADKTLTPKVFFETVKALPGAATKVIQINHPRGSTGYFTSIGMDFATGKTALDPALLHMPTDEVKGDDTGLFDLGFSAIEVMNGRNLGAFESRMADVFALYQRGINKTATAVSDTHRAYSGDMGNPLTWVWVGAGKDSAPTFDSAAWVDGINKGKAFGSDGPFLDVTASTANGSAALGETLPLPSAGGTVDVNVTVQVPTWYGFESIDLYVNAGTTGAKPFEQESGLPAPTESFPVDLSAETPVDGAGLAAGTSHKRYLVSHTFSLTPTEDSWIVVMVRGTKANGFPVLLSGSTDAISFTNPIFIDVGQDGYSSPINGFDAGPRRTGVRPIPDRWRRADLKPSDEELRERLRHFARSEAHWTPPKR